jgi:hypothetical protein
MASIRSAIVRSRSALACWSRGAVSVVLIERVESQTGRNRHIAHSRRCDRLRLASPRLVHGASSLPLLPHTPEGRKRFQILERSSYATKEPTVRLVTIHLFSSEPEQLVAGGVAPAPASPGRSRPTKSGDIRPHRPSSSANRARRPRFAVIGGNRPRCSILVTRSRRTPGQCRRQWPGRLRPSTRGVLRVRRCAASRRRCTNRAESATRRSPPGT